MAVFYSKKKKKTEQTNKRQSGREQEGGYIGGIGDLNELKYDPMNAMKMPAHTQILIIKH